MKFLASSPRQVALWILLFASLSALLVNLTTLQFVFPSKANQDSDIRDRIHAAPAQSTTGIEYPFLRVPTPIFLLSLPKSGTTSIYKYFGCGNVPAVHHVTKNETGHKFKIGVCMSDNVNKFNRPLLKGCGDHHYKVWTDAGAIFDLKNPQCYYPSVHGLDDIVKDYPQATIMLVVRNTTNWVHSTKWWNGIRPNMERFCSGFPNVSSTDQDWADFYESHSQSIRDFVQIHPSLTYVEVSLESSSTASYLENRVGIPASCWKDSKPPDPRKKIKEKIASEKTKNKKRGG